MPKGILALTTDGTMTYCTASPENRGKGKCNHLLHQEKNESTSDFLAKNNLIQSLLMSPPEDPKAWERAAKTRKCDLLEMGVTNAFQRMVGKKIKIPEHLKDLCPNAGKEGTVVIVGGQELSPEGKKIETIYNEGSGMPKTDVYVGIDCEGKGNITDQIKFSIKADNADMVENHLTEARYKAVFGDLPPENLLEGVNKDQIKEHILRNVKGNESWGGKLPVSFSLMIGMQESKTLCNDLDNVDGYDKTKTHTLAEVYAGANLDEAKKHCNVQDSKIMDSGIANCMLHYSITQPNNYKSILDATTPMPTADTKDGSDKLYYRLQAANYTDKIHHNGTHCHLNPAFTTINWDVKDGKLAPTLNKPYKGNAADSADSVDKALKKLNKKSISELVAPYKKELDNATTASAKKAVYDKMENELFDFSWL